jgi:primosomal protein N'
MIELRPYQNQAIEKLRRAIASGHKRVLLQAATGAGKTIIASEMIRLAMLKGKRALFPYSGLKPSPLGEQIYLRYYPDNSFTQL